MLKYTAFTEFTPLQQSVVSDEASKLADDIARAVSNEFRLALVFYGKIATSKTIKSVAAEKILDSPTRGVFMRNVVASKVWEFIQNGRLAGKKLPPEAALLEWFKALNIPRRAWFPIRLSIARKGIKPRKLRERALREARQSITESSRLRTDNIKRRLFEGKIGGIITKTK